MSVPSTNPLPLWTVVALKSHPFAYGINPENLLLRGDGESIPPLLVIGEAMRTVKSNFDEQTGVELAVKNDYSYKCYWYSLKSREFKNTWIQGKHVVAVKECPFNLLDDTYLKKVRNLIKEGVLVNFNSASYELEKVKCTNRYNKDFSPQSPNLGNLVSFIAPTMELIGLVNPDDKEPKFDAKDGELKRFKTKMFGKCRYFNPEQNKFTEIPLPIETLSIVEMPGSDLLEKINEAIKNKEYLEIETNGKLDIINPIKIAFAGGTWAVWGESVFSYKMVSYQIDSVLKGKILFNKLGQLPDIKTTSETILLKEINLENLKDYLLTFKDFKYLTIIYENHLGKLSKRALSAVKIIEGIKVEGVTTETVWLHGFCHLKNAERTFKLKKVREIQFIGIKEA